MFHGLPDRGSWAAGRAKTLPTSLMTGLATPRSRTSAAMPEKMSAKPLRCKGAGVAISCTPIGPLHPPCRLIPYMVSTFDQGGQTPARDAPQSGG